jgi:hypothetical protein
VHHADPQLKGRVLGREPVQAGMGWS